jgi:hypothetical protein
MLFANLPDSKVEESKRKMKVNKSMFGDTVFAITPECLRDSALYDLIHEGLFHYIKEFQGLDYPTPDLFLQDMGGCLTVEMCCTYTSTSGDTRYWALMLRDKSSRFYICKYDEISDCKGYSEFDCYTYSYTKAVAAYKGLADQMRRESFDSRNVPATSEIQDEQARTEREQEMESQYQTMQLSLMALIATRKLNFGELESLKAQAEKFASTI